uniref:Scavenger receptor class F member 1 n=1 Tax=Myripristis murdjan TaxID=586833 RepID=A0A667X290_9TELE
MRPLLGALTALLCCSLSSSQTLDPDGRNICQNLRDPSTLVCCTGWRQEGKECSIPVCEGKHACLKDELCVYPGVCRCPAGFYGAHCKTSCPPEFWAPDCREVCQCHPHGQCHSSTGVCTCNSNRWGPVCQYACKCGRHSHCNPVHGNCTCNEGWWTPTCTKPCQCVSGGAVGMACDQLTGRCQCRRGHWGQKCSLTCNCYMSPCNQRTGVCECQAGWWGHSCDRHCNCDLTHSRCDPVNGQCLCHPGYKGDFCNKPCDAGQYGSGCILSCGHCRDGQSCSPTDGVCAACEPGWNGTRCDRLCTLGFYGDGCQEKCPRCKNSEPCDPKTGRCWRCDPGWTGPRCEDACTNRTFGDACNFRCGPCFHGNCHHVTGRCVCQPGYQGESCNSSCPALQYGLNCSSACDCGEGISCHPATGACPSSTSLHPYLCVCVCRAEGHQVSRGCVFMCLCVCVCVRCARGSAGRCAGASVPGAAGRALLLSVLWRRLCRWQRQVRTSLPSLPLSHHDPELTFNHSFIEPPSYGWVTEGSSFDSDEEEGEALYCVPPREEGLLSLQTAMSSKCNMFLDPSGFSCEDMAQPFNIPRTSSIAKSKRPSVSFAEGTRFSPKERRGSAQDLGSGPRTKSKSGEEDEAPAPAPDATNKVTTVYVTVGKAGRPVSKVESSSEGPVQAMLRRLGSLQRQREQEAGRPKAKGAEGITKPPRRKLGARASVWEQGGPSGAGEGSISKPIRRKHASLNTPGTAGTNDTPSSESGTPKRPLSSILKSVPEGSSVDSGSEVRADGARVQGGSPSAGHTECNYLTVGPVADAGSLTEVIANEGAVASANDEPSYENVMIKHP